MSIITKSLYCFTQYHLKINLCVSQDMEILYVHNQISFSCNGSLPISFDPNGSLPRHFKNQKQCQYQVSVLFYAVLNKNLKVEISRWYYSNPSQQSLYMWIQWMGLSLMFINYFCMHPTNALESKSLDQDSGYVMMVYFDVATFTRWCCQRQNKLEKYFESKDLTNDGGQQPHLER